jgi:methionyl-tRNA formyltransferase
VFALYDGNVRFGVTVHEMAARVDSGAIVAADWFDIPAGCDLGQLEELTFLRLIDAFRRLAPQMAHIDRPLPHAIYRWSGRKTTKAECDALCRLAPDLTPEEVARRRQACGAFLVDG